MGHVVYLFVFLHRCHDLDQVTQAESHQRMCFKYLIQRTTKESIAFRYDEKRATDKAILI